MIFMQVRIRLVNQTNPQMVYFFQAPQSTL